MKQLPAHEVLHRIFKVIMREAQKNPALAEELVEAIGGGATPGAKVSSAAPRKSFDASEFHAVNILRLHGEAALRGRLEQVKAVDSLKSVARVSGLVLTGGACKARPSRADLISGIIAAAKHYDAQRSAACT
jgi:hypothetical protein